MIEIKKSMASQDISDGIVEGKDVKKSDKLLKDVAEIYANPKNAIKDQEKKAYTVYSYTMGDEGQPGNLFWGLSVLYPLDVDGECNMTRGHFHEDRKCAEFYYGISGEGILVLMDSSGKTWGEKVEPGSLHHIDGNLAHRLVNTSDTELRVGACWPTTAGHDYEAIEEKSFGYRVFKKDGKIEFLMEPN